MRIVPISVPTPFYIGAVNVYLIKEDPVTIIDTGPKTTEAIETLRAGLRQAGLNVSDVRRIILTHAHEDHIGAVAHLWPRLKVPVYATPFTAALVRAIAFFPFSRFKGMHSLGVVVSFGGARDPGESLKPLSDLVREDMDAINRIILDKAVSDVELIPQLAHHLIDSGGKRLRPMIAIASAKLSQYGGTGHIRIGAAVEFLHTATLLHDDVVDESDLRRGKTAARLLCGNEASVLVGDFLLGQAFRMMVEVGSLPALKILSNAAAIIAEGEVMQLAAANDTATTEDEYLAIIAAKTAALFSAATEVGAAIANRPAAEQTALKSYGRNLGIAFQLVDDALDYCGDTSRLGKSVGDDFREGKITLPVILCFRRGSEQERGFWKRTLCEGRIEEGDFDQAVRFMKKHSAIEATLERARHYGEIARDALAIFPSGTHTHALANVIGFCVSRTS